MYTYAIYLILWLKKWLVFWYLRLCASDSRLMKLISYKIIVYIYIYICIYYYVYSETSYKGHFWGTNIWPLYKRLAFGQWGLYKEGPLYTLVGQFVWFILFYQKCVCTILAYSSQWRDRNLFAGSIAMILGSFKQAQELFLASSDPTAALKVSVLVCTCIVYLW